METVEEKPKRGKKSVDEAPAVAAVAEASWEPKVGLTVIYWLQLGPSLHGYPAIITNASFDKPGLWDMVRFQPVNGNAAVPVFNAEYSDKPSEGKFTKAE